MMQGHYECMQKAIHHWQPWCFSGCDWEGVWLKLMTFPVCACVVAVFSHVMNFYHLWKEEINRLLRGCFKKIPWMEERRKWNDIFGFYGRNELMHFLSRTTLWLYMRRCLARDCFINSVSSFSSTSYCEVLVNARFQLVFVYILGIFLDSASVNDTAAVDWYF